MKTILPQTLLEKGTPVRVGNKRGIVTDSKLVDAANGGKIAITMVCLSEIFKRGFGTTGKWEKLKNPLCQTANYSFIELL